VPSLPPPQLATVTRTFFQLCMLCYVLLWVEMDSHHQRPTTVTSWGLGSGPFMPRVLSHPVDWTLPSQEAPALVCHVGHSAQSTNSGWALGCVHSLGMGWRYTSTESWRR
jgi:hypothetical protein